MRPSSRLDLVDVIRRLHSKPRHRPSDVTTEGHEPNTTTIALLRPRIPALHPSAQYFLALFIRLLCIERSTHHFSSAVNPGAGAPKISGKRAEVHHHTVLPQEGVKTFVACQGRHTGYRVDE